MKRKLLLLFLLVFAVLPNCVNANTFKANFYGDEVTSVGDKVEFTLEIDTDIQASKLTMTLKYDSNVLELLNITSEESWKSESAISNNNLKFVNNGVTGKSSVATLRFKVKNSSARNQFVVTLDDIKISTSQSDDGTSVILNHEVINKNVKLKSDDNSLSTIKINDKKIKNFSPSNYNYTVEVDSIYDNIKISSSLNDSNAKYVDDFGDRTVDLNYGENKIELKIASESGKIGTYILTIIRKDDRLVDNDLKSIIINGGKIKLEFDKSVLNYTVKGYKLEEIELEVETSDKDATYKINKPEKVVIGENKYTIVVKAVTGDEKTYTVIVINNDQKTNTKLKNLAIKGISIDFNPDRYQYKIRYDDSFKKGLTLYKTALSNDTEIKVIGNGNLKPGDEIKIIVDAIDGSDTSTYTIKLLEDTRINFFLIIELIMMAILIILIFIQLNKRKKKKEKIVEQKIMEELEKTKEIKL